MNADQGGRESARPSREAQVESVRRAAAAAAEAGHITWGEANRLVSQAYADYDALTLHDDPCVCGAYDRCKGVRAEDARRESTQARAIRALHRAYND